MAQRTGTPGPAPELAERPGSELDGAGSRPLAGYRTNLVTMVLGLWFTSGLFLDAWAHNNVPELETFFTAWHGVFYSGFTASAAWIVWTSRRALLERRWAMIPVGYSASLAALVMFAVAGVGDMVWHELFGIEQSIDILFSPTHLALVTSMFVIVTTPLRASWADRSLTGAPGFRRLLPALGSTSLATTLVLLFLQYANVLAFHSGDVVGGLSGLDEGWTAGLVSSMAVTNLVLLAPLLALARRWVLPFGTAILVYASVAGLSGAVTGFNNAWMLVGLLGAALCVDGLGRALRPTPERPARLRAFAAVAPVITWSVFIATAYATAPPPHLPPDGSVDRPGAVVELYTGAPMVQGLIGLLLACLLTADREERSGARGGR